MELKKWKKLAPWKKRILKGAIIGAIFGSLLFIISIIHQNSVRHECWECLLYWLPIFPFLWLGDSLQYNIDGYLVYVISFVIGYTLWGAIIGGLYHLINRKK